MYIEKKHVFSIIFSFFCDGYVSSDSSFGQVVPASVCLSYVGLLQVERENTEYVRVRIKYKCKYKCWLKF